MPRPLRGWPAEYPVVGAGLARRDTGLARGPALRCSYWEMSEPPADKEPQPTAAERVGRFSGTAFRVGIKAALRWKPLNEAVRRAREEAAEKGEPTRPKER